MGRAFETIRTLPLETLFGYFGLEAEQELIAAHRDAIAQRFAAEVGEIVRLCRRLREKERFTLFREALRLSYDGAVLRAASRDAVAPERPRREPVAPRGIPPAGAGFAPA